MKKQIQTNNAPSAIGPYSQGIQLNDLFFFSGQIPIDPKTGLLVNGVVEQTKQVLENIKGLLESQNMDFTNVVKTTIFIDNMDDFKMINEVYLTYFKPPYPARSTVEVSKLPLGSLVEIEVIASK